MTRCITTKNILNQIQPQFFTYILDDQDMVTYLNKLNYFSIYFLFSCLSKGHQNHCAEQLPRETDQTWTSPDEHVISDPAATSYVLVDYRTDKHCTHGNIKTPLCTLYKFNSSSRSEVHLSICGFLFLWFLIG